MHDIAIRVKNYKCFKEETGFDSFRRVNLIIGRNNSGKSSLLDLIEIVVTGEYEVDRSTWRDNQQPELLFESEITKADINKVFSIHTVGGEIRHHLTHNDYGLEYVGRKLKWAQNSTGQTGRVFVKCDAKGVYPKLMNAGNHYTQHLLNQMTVSIEEKVFRRLLAERDILPEKAEPQNITIGTNGAGITNAIQNFINKSNLPSALVESNILDALNSIFAHDAIFTDIVCQLHDDDHWEIYLEEEFKGRIALSKSGSGLKTVISVLACLILVPHLESRPLSEYVFGFEELENNIHPALLRRLNNFVYLAAVENDFSYAITTHSNVLIDQFSKQDDAQIIHVTHRHSVATCTTANTYIKNNGILDDLDVRASDLLQANGVIWVEGPSDRIYLNRWISLWSDGDLKEGTHYQIIFYGGRLLSHLNAEAPEDVESGISILNANRNAIMLIDSDKKTKQKPINDTKKRIKAEFEAMDAYCWITQGKEIENYIPASIVDAFWEKKNVKQVGQYESFFDYLDKIIPNEGRKYNAKKPLLAERLIPHMTRENLSQVLDLDRHMVKVCASIRSWNS